MYDLQYVHMSVRKHQVPGADLFLALSLQPIQQELN